MAFQLSCSGAGDSPESQGHTVDAEIPGSVEVGIEKNTVNTSEDKSGIRYNFEDKKPAHISLPKFLMEISGLALADDGRMFAHNDEVGVIHQIDFASGKVVKSWSLGPKKVKADFEGIAIVGEMFYLTTNAGQIYKFREGADKTEVDYEVFDSGLTQEQDVEGLCYDPYTNSLLLACKNDPGQGLEDSRAIYRLGLPLGTSTAELNTVLALEQIIKRSDDSEFMPSGIAIHPGTKRLLLVASRGKTLLDCSADGSVFAQFNLPKKTHEQPEGICIAADGVVYIANEGAGGKAKIMRYEPLN